MKRSYIARELNELSAGKSRMIAWGCVTRWAADAYEIGTWGKNQSTLADTLETLCALRKVTA